MKRVATLGLIVLAGASLAACVQQSTPPQRVGNGYQQPAYGYYGPPVQGYTPQSNTQWSTLGASQPQAYTGTVDPSQISRDGITAPIRGFRGAEATGFRVAYGKSKDQKLDQVRAAFQKEQVFEKIAVELNNTLRMPRLIDIHLVDCGVVNAFYDPKNSRIILCYEFIGYLADMFKGKTKTDQELGTAVIGATFFAFFHELGHALRHQLDLPVTGKEEDAVDQLATLILMQGGDQGVQAALSGAYWFRLQSDANKDDSQKLPFWDEHSLDQQRFYNIACLIYGSDPDKYANLTENDFLPKDRAVRCKDEYTNISGAWTKLLEPHMGPSGPVVSNNGTVPTAPPTNTQQPTGIPQAQTASCEAVTDHALELIVAAYAVEMQAMSQEEQAMYQQQMVEMLPTLRATLIQTCYDEPWSQQTKECVLRAQNMQQAELCQ